MIKRHVADEAKRQEAIRNQFAVVIRENQERRAEAMLLSAANLARQGRGDAREKFAALFV